MSGVGPMKGSLGVIGPNRKSRGLRLLLCAALAVPVIAIGCAAATGNKGIEQKLTGMEMRMSTKEKNTRDITAKRTRDIITAENDKWTMRILAIGGILMGLSYPVGKLVWIAAERAKSAATASASAALLKKRLREAT